MYSKELIKGTLQPIVLTLLKENKRMYGYEITQKVKEITHNKIELTEGALYPTLHKLEADGILTVEKTLIGKRIRKYYTLTQKGHSAIEQTIQDFSEFIQSMNLILKHQLR
ncbi:MAG: helix-turn-helix transcriptional regulator [Bacteroidia bacterium]|nr:helix-turn-helix transcriptional regulator [Bacteroidia bacterium]